MKPTSEGDAAGPGELFSVRFTPSNTSPQTGICRAPCAGWELAAVDIRCNGITPETHRRCASWASAGSGLSSRSAMSPAALPPSPSLAVAARAVRGVELGAESRLLRVAFGGAEPRQ